LLEGSCRFEYNETAQMKTTSKLILVSVSLWNFLALATLAATNTINIVNFDFVSPQTSTHVDPTIILGDTVQWVWVSGFHSTTAAAGQLETWDSGQHFPPFTNTHTFSELGTFNYRCTVHGSDTGCGHAGGMSGKITVVLTGAVPYRVTAVAREGDDIRVSWITGGICRTNALQRATGDASGSYTNAYTDILLLTNTVGNVTNYLDIGAATNFPASYYRVRVP
jgi:plastocyanin